MHYIKIEIDDEEQYERLKEIKDSHGMTWKGILLRGAKGLDSDGPLSED